MKTKLHFSRFEFKYILHERLRKDFEGELGYFMQLDPYVSTLKNNKYFVRSLYYDNDSYTNYFEKTDGVKSRYKYRIRTYTDDKTEQCSIFLEIKGRYNALVYKHRVELPMSVKGEFHKGSPLLVSHLMKSIGNEEVFRKFYYDFYRMNLKPVTLIDYYRRPYISKFSPDFRVTFDEALHSYDTDHLFPRPQDRDRSVMAGYTIMEIKFGRVIPSWFHRLIQSYELYRLSISKFCHGMEKLDLVRNLE